MHEFRFHLFSMLYTHCFLHVLYAKKRIAWADWNFLFSAMKRFHTLFSVGNTIIREKNLA